MLAIEKPKENDLINKSNKIKIKPITDIPKIQIRKAKPKVKIIVLIKVLL